MTNFKRSVCEGQALVEVTAVLFLITFSCAGIARILKDQWFKSLCAYFVFEAVHSKLTGKHPPSSGFLIRLRDTGTGVIGIGKCGTSTEIVRLPRLESANWR